MTPTLEAAISKLHEKADALALAVTTEQSLEDDRAAIKADAIKRVMEREKIAATNAEKIVETDEQYFLHRGKQRAQIVARFRADAEYWAAKCEATQASLVTPDVFSLQSKNEQLSKLIGFLDDNNKGLVYANKELEGRLTLANEAIAFLQSEVENSVETIP